MKKPISLPLPKCAKCKKTLEPQFTTELEDGDESKPKIIMMYGICEDCKIITMCDIIKTKDLPTFKDAISENQENHSQLSEVNRNLQEKKDYNHLSGRRDNESGAVVESPASTSPADTNLSESSEVKG